MAEGMPSGGLPPGSRPRARPGDGAEGLTVTPELLDEFSASLLEQGRARETIQTYRNKLDRLYSWLPEDKQICRGTLEAWRSSLLAEGYAARTVNLRMSAANSLLEYCGRRELQVCRPLEPKEDIRPELTRSEYLRLLSTARALDKEREYLLIKIFCSTGLTLHDLPLLTAEAAEAGELRLASAVLRIPGCLREELLDYIGREGIASGPVFVTKAGKPLDRTSVTNMIRRLCRDARVPEERANPRCLKKLYQATQAGIQANISLLMEQAHDRLLETEQLAIGWKQGR